MAKTPASRTGRDPRKAAAPGRSRAVQRVGKLELATRNFRLMGAAGVAIAGGYIALWQGSITLAPFLLVLGYCVLLPLSLLWRTPKVNQGE